MDNYGILGPILESWYELWSPLGTILKFWGKIWSPQIQKEIYIFKLTKEGPIKNYSEWHSPFNTGLNDKYAKNIFLFLEGGGEFSHMA